MSKRTFTGSASTTQAQVWKGTVTDTTTGHVATVTLTDESGGTVAVSYTVQSGDGGSASTIATNFAAAWNASTDPRIQTITATTSGAVVILTANTAGVPFSVAASGTGTLTSTGITTANIGPLDVLCPQNYVEEVAPVASDDITFVSGSIAYNLRQGAVFTGKITFAPTFTGSVGAVGQRLVMTPTAFTFSASGTSAAFIDLNTANIDARVDSTAAVSSGYGLDLIGSNVATLTVNGGTVGVGVNAGETPTVATLANNGGTVTVGSGATLTTGSQSSGTGMISCAVTTLSVSGGTLTTRGTGAVTTVNVNGGTFVGNSSGTIGTLNVRNGATADLTQNRVTRTVTTTNVEIGSTLKADSSIVTFTNKPAPGNGQWSMSVKAA